MGLADILHGVGEVAAVAMGAQSYDFGAPTQKPSVLPWVTITHSTSTSESKTYSLRDPADNRLKARGKLRKHTGTGYVLLSVNGDTATEDEMAIEAVQDLMDSFDDDQELFGIGSEKRCDKVWLENLDRFRADWEGTVYAGVQFQWNVIEL